MSTCNKCNVEVIDNSFVCPLCRGILEVEASDKVMPYPMYPDIRYNVHKLNFVLRIYLFVAIVSEFILIIINYFTYSGILWSIISGASIFYMFVFLKYIINSNTKHTIKIFMQTLGCILLLLVIDYSLGYSGWALNYAVPSTIFLLCLTITALMIINISNWPGYILLQIFSLILSIILLILYFGGVIEHLLFTFIAFASSLSLFIGTLIIGDKQAHTEIKRRFRI